MTITYPFEFDPAIQMVLIVPFRIGLQTVPYPAARRKQLFPKIADSLNQSPGELRWEAVEFGDEEPVCTFVKQKKGMFLRGTPSPAAARQWGEWIDELAAQNSNTGLRLV